MFNYYHLTIGNSTQTHKLSYKLKQHRPAQAWAKLMYDTNLSKLREGHSIWYGIPQDPTPYVNELFSLLDQLNQWMPKKITHHWDSSNLQASANIFHTHFPEHKDDKNPVHRMQLERYNDLIHYIENIDRSNQFSYPAMHLLVSTDKVELELDDYQYFTTCRQFGDLQLGYPHIGRHPLEIMWANDVDVPTDQILPQNLLSGFHWCRFYDSLSHVRTMEKFKKFYYASKIQWPYELGDPRLAVGDLNIGTLESVNDQSLPREKILSLITSCNQVIGWTIE
jgi:hypothetical protein